MAVFRVAFFAEDFLTVFFAAFFAGDFLTAFFAADFLTAFFAAFFAGDFRVAVFLVAFLADFFAVLRPDPDRLPPPSCLLTVAQAMRSASSRGRPSSSSLSSMCSAWRFCLSV
ncbi:MAG TPA: hypothetical protein VGD21_15970 [Lysobacter sp.]